MTNTQPHKRCQRGVGLQDRKPILSTIWRAPIRRASEQLGETPDDDSVVKKIQHLYGPIRPGVAVGLMVGGFAVLSACHSSDDAAAAADAQAGAANSALIPSLFGGGASTLTRVTESEEALAIAASFPNPELPSAAEPFRTQPNQRFEQWSLSAMMQNADTGDWQWTEQQFFRIAVVAENGEDTVSAWGFRDIMAQRYTTYNFGSKQSQSTSSAERRAMQLSDVTERSVFVNDNVATIESNGCGSNITLDRRGTSLSWIATDCPNRIQLGSTIVSTADSAFINGVGWMSHAYGQLPVSGGAVILDQFEVRLPDETKLRVNRSRRRSGTGPVTVAASLTSNGQTQSLRDVQWVEQFDGEAMFPSEIRIDVPSLSLALDVEVPLTLPNGLLGAGFGVRHGVLITIDNTVLPGVMTLQPRTQEAS